MAVVAPTTAICAVALPVVVSAVLGESMSLRGMLGVGIGLLAIVLVSRGQTPSDPDVSSTPPASAADPDIVAAPAPLVVESAAALQHRAVATALVSGVAIGLFFLALARTDASAGLWPLVAARTTSMLLFGIAIASGAGTLRIARSVLALAIVGGATDMLANALYLIASRRGVFSIVVTLSSLYPASTVILARVVLGERLSRWQQLGVVCALMAVVLMVGG
jgi:drug/metabolite transporter (DMT)-like permease